MMFQHDSTMQSRDTYLMASISIARPTVPVYRGVSMGIFLNNIKCHTSAFCCTSSESSSDEDYVKFEKKMCTVSY